MSDLPSTTPDSAPALSRNLPPLCVDLDGTILLTDLLWESLVALLRRNPLFLFVVPFWLLRGRAHVKRQIASRVNLDAASLPYNEPFVQWLRGENERGRTIILVTASDQTLAQGVADHLQLFQEVLATTAGENLKGIHKSRRLTQRFGERNFDYAGDSPADLDVWPAARQAIIVNASPALARKAFQLNRNSEIQGEKSPSGFQLFRSLRPHQWVKNLVVLVPIITSHQLTSMAILREGLLALLAFSLCASAVYLVNDLTDLEADRKHPTKRKRPLASGQVALSHAIVAAPILFVAAAVVAAMVNPGLVIVLALYALLTLAYSWRLKQVALLDVMVLAGLYTLRLIAGHTATGIPYSVWLLAFSMFIFLSLALLKRFTELTQARELDQHSLQGRGYGAGDLEIVTMLGLCSGLLSVLVLALYVNSDDVRILYQHPTLLLLICPLFLYWISRVWMIGHRGQMHDDPVVFALRDPISYVLALIVFAVLLIAT